MWDLYPTGRIRQMPWSSTPTHHTFLTCGRRRCFRTQRRRGKKGGGKGWEPPHSTPRHAASFLSTCLAGLLIHLLFFPETSVRLSQEQKRCMENSTLQREVKKVRKVRNRRQEWNMMAFDKELRPDHRHPQSLRRGASSEGSLSPDGRSVLIFWFRERWVLLSGIASLHCI